MMNNIDNKKMQKVHKNPALKWIFGVSEKLKYQLLLLVLLNSLISVSVVMFAVVLKDTVDAAVTGAKIAFFRYVFLLGVLVFVQIAFKAVIRRMDEYVRADMENRLKCRTYKTILSRKYDSITSFHTGELLNRMTNDVVVVADGFAQIIPGIIAMLVKMLGAAVVLFLLDYRFAVIYSAGGAVLLMFTAMFRKVMKRLHKDVQAADGVVRSHLQENLGSLMVLKTFGVENKSLLASEEYMEKHKQVRMKKNMFSNLCNIGFGLVMNGGYLFGLVWCGCGILFGNITLGTLSAVLQLVDQLQQPFANITGYLPKFYGMLSSAERLMELEALDEEIIEDKKDKVFCYEFYRSMERLVCDKIDFAYEGNQVFKNAEFTIDKGEFVAVMGSSGAGKSTLLKLLLAMYMPDSGQLYFEGAGNQYPVTDSYRGMFAYVPQGNFLMSGTIRDAIVFLDDNGSNIDIERVYNAAHIACVDTFAEKLEKGYDTVIGERGLGISEGQAQRIAIARALYTDAPVLLFDEATSALDESTEKQVLKNIRELTDKTLIIVTHRKAVLELCDRCVVLEDKHFE